MKAQKPFPTVITHHRIPPGASGRLVEVLLIIGLLLLGIAAAFSNEPRPAPRPTCADVKAYRVHVEKLANALVGVWRVGITENPEEDLSSLREAAVVLNAQSAFIGKLVCNVQAKGG